MKRVVQYLQLSVLIYFLVLLIFFVAFDMLGAMFGMVPLTPESLVKIFLSGFILFLAAWGAALVYRSNLHDQIRKMTVEMNALKAKLYDYEHPKAPKSTQSVPQKNQDEIPGNLRPRQNFTDQ